MDVTFIMFTVCFVATNEQKNDSCQLATMCFASSLLVTCRDVLKTEEKVEIL